MPRTPHAGIQEVASRILAEAVSSYPRLEKPETFSIVLNAILEQVGSSIRIVLKQPDAPEIDTSAGKQLPNDLEHRLTFHLQHVNSHTWSALANMLSCMKECWAESPFMPANLTKAPVAIWGQGLATFVPEAFGEATRPLAEELSEQLRTDRESVFKGHPAFRSVVAKLTPDESGLLAVSAVATRNILLEGNTATGVFFANAFARLASHYPLMERQISLEVLNALRSHQILAVTQCAAQALRTLRDTRAPTDHEYFSEIIEKHRRELVKLHWLLTTDDVSDDESAQRADSMWESLNAPDSPGTNKDDRLRAETERALGGLLRLQAEGELEDEQIAFVNAFSDTWAFLRNPPFENPEKVRDVIDAARCRNELEAARRMHDADALGVKEAEVVARVLHAVVRFPHSHAGLDMTEPDIGGGTPRYVREYGKINCFTGPWLAATMLLECGIPEGQILYCDVQNPNGVVSGPHGSLLIALSSGQQMMMDTGFRRVKEVPSSLYTESARKKLRVLIQEESLKVDKDLLAPVRLKLKDKLPIQTGIHSDMTIMPMRSGFAWGSLMTVGLKALEENNIDVARHTFELAHGLHPESPDVLCHLGRSYDLEGDQDEAIAWINVALSLYPEHKMSLYFRSMIHIARKEYGEAFLDLKSLLFSAKEWFGGKHHLDHARRMYEHVNSILRAEDRTLILETESNLLQSE